ADLIADGLRALRVNGRVLDGAGVAGAAVQVLGNSALSSSAVLNTVTDADGAYELRLPLKAGVAAGSVTVRASLNDRAAESDLTAFTLEGVDAVLTVADLTLSQAPLPARLLLSGVVQDASSQPVPGASVTVSSAALQRGGAAVTDSDGLYTLELTLIPGVTSGSLELHASSGSGSAISNLPFSGAIPGGTLTVNASALRFSRLVTFTGVIRNATVPSLAVNTQIGIYAGQTLLCNSGVAWSVVENNAVGSYTCAVKTQTAESFEASINAVGVWGASSVTVTVPAATSGAVSTVTQDLIVAPTLLRVAGTVLDSGGAPSVNSSLRFTAAGLEGNTVALTTDARGEYVGYGIVLPGATSLEVGFVVRDAGNNVSSRSLTLGVIPNTLMERTENFTLENRLPGLARWSASISATSTPAVASSGALYVTTAQGVQAFDADGAPRWTFPHGSGAVTVAESGTVYVGGERLYAVNPDGTERWSFGFGSGTGAPAVGADGTIYVTSSAGALHAIQPNSSLKWQTQIPGVNAQNAPVISGEDHLYAS
ncbi:MAG: PQQ-binding-like beta-propeller repeat protein, partial [Pleurocapsa sp. SU_196_0]|nr:PQQ-binding-like beta-propeller repeat protein [Pleurocapsa sp. SU_196_0]